ncbi:hypothetical protein [Aquipuribacter hungaricus]|uniref:hypothetical protein n=1 Tax=Aquipuribacter hungaricus TaxID=545624 RepID=UPI0036113C89
MQEVNRLLHDEGPRPAAVDGCGRWGGWADIDEVDEVVEDVGDVAADGGGDVATDEEAVEQVQGERQQWRGWLRRCRYGVDAVHVRAGSSSSVRCW